MKILNCKSQKIFDVLQKSKKFQKYIIDNRTELLSLISSEPPKVADILNGNMPKSIDDRAKELALQTIQTFQLPFYWLDSLTTYFISGKLEMPTVPFIVEMKIDESGYRQLSMHISKSTTIEDIKQNWAFIKQMQSLIPEIEASTIDDRHYAIYEMKQQGKNKQEIIHALEKDYNYVADTLMIDVAYSRVKALVE